MAIQFTKVTRVTRPKILDIHFDVYQKLSKEMQDEIDRRTLREKMAQLVIK